MSNPNKPNNMQVLLNGIIKENPVLVLILGTCPSLAVTTMASNGLGMGVAAMVVLICSNIAISLLKKVIPDTVRIPCYIVVIASFVTLVQFLVKAYLPDLDKALGVYLPLIVVNCIILGRAEMFANKNGVVASICDGIGMGLGFTLALFCMGSIRELLGNGTWMGITITAKLWDPIIVFLLAPGGFMVYGALIALVNYLTKGKAIKKKEFGCAGCPSAASCSVAQKGGCEA
ncbi:MAG: electron transport complex subunit E [Anaerotruncus sp.]|jgi:electron transport complex protein RnfE|nr:electron transport complex subunit E [Anaerotruncus sp.]